MHLYAISPTRKWGIYYSLDIICVLYLAKETSTGDALGDFRYRCLCCQIMLVIVACIPTITSLRGAAAVRHKCWQSVPKTAPSRKHDSSHQQYVRAGTGETFTRTFGYLIGYPASLADLPEVGLLRAIDRLCRNCCANDRLWVQACIWYHYIICT